MPMSCVKGRKFAGRQVSKRSSVLRQTSPKPQAEITTLSKVGTLRSRLFRAGALGSPTNDTRDTVVMGPLILDPYPFGQKCDTLRPYLKV